MLIDVDSRSFAIPGYAGATVDVRPLTVDAWQKSVRIIHKNKDAGPITLMVDNETLWLAREVLPEHVSNLRGITVRAAGETRDASLKDLTTYAPLFNAALAILAHLVAISTVTEADAGNSDGPHQSTPSSAHSLTDSN